MHLPDKWGNLNVYTHHSRNCGVQSVHPSISVSICIIMPTPHVPPPIAREADQRRIKQTSGGGGGWGGRTRARSLWA
jgi:hypothetical protein